MIKNVCCSGLLVMSIVVVALFYQLDGEEPPAKEIDIRDVEHALRLTSEKLKPKLTANEVISNYSALRDELSGTRLIHAQVEVILSSLENMSDDEALVLLDSLRADLSPLTLRNRIIIPFAERIANLDPMVISDWLTNLSTSEVDLAIATAVGRVLPHQRVDMVSRKLPEGPLRKELIGSMLSVDADANGVLNAFDKGLAMGIDTAVLGEWAIRWCESSDDLKSLYDQLARNGEINIELFVERWSRFDPEEAMSFSIAEFGDAASADAIGKGVRNWAELDSRACSAWVAELPNSEARGSAIEALVSSLSSTIYDPEGALAWASVIEDPVRREQFTEDILNKWRSINPEEADIAELRYLDGQEIPTE